MLEVLICIWRLRSWISWWRGLKMWLATGGSITGRTSEFSPHFLKLQLLLLSLILLDFPESSARGQQTPDEKKLRMIPGWFLSFWFTCHWFVSVHVRFEHFNRKYLRRFLIRKDRQGGSSILRVYQELERREQRGDEEAPPPPPPPPLWGIPFLAQVRILRLKDLRTFIVYHIFTTPTLAKFVSKLHM